MNLDCIALRIFPKMIDAACYNRVRLALRRRFCWMIEFVHHEVLAASRDHPDLIAFTNQLLQPATEPLTIDFADSLRTGYRR
jgi:hypothetical protein